MNSTIENSISRIAEKARGRYQAILMDARSRTEKAAGRVTQGKKPVKTFSKLGLKLTATSHRTADKVLKQQTKMVEHQIDAFADRLAAAAEANGVRDLVKTQFRLIPKNAALLVNDTRAALGIFVGAGAEVRSLIRDTAEELRGRKPAAAKATTKATAKTPAAPRKKSAKKKTAKKAPVAKKVVIEAEVEAPKAA
jgi:hypothetical protein